MSVLHTNKPYRIISRREFFSNPSFYEKYRSLLEYKPYKSPEFDKDKFKKTGETVDLNASWIKSLYEEKVNAIVSEIKRAVPSNKNEQLKAVFNYMVKRCKYWDDYPRGTDRFKCSISTW